MSDDENQALEGIVDATANWNIKSFRTDVRRAIVATAHREGLTAAQFITRMYEGWVQGGATQAVVPTFTPRVPTLTPRVPLPPGDYKAYGSTDRTSQVVALSTAAGALGGPRSKVVARARRAVIQLLDEISPT